MNTEEELRHMVGLLNEKAFGEPGTSRLELRMHDRPDLDGVLAFIVLVQDGYVDIDQKTIVMPIPPITILLIWHAKLLLKNSPLAAIYCAGSCRLLPAVWTN